MFITLMDHYLAPLGLMMNTAQNTLSIVRIKLNSPESQYACVLSDYKE